MKTGETQQGVNIQKMTYLSAQWPLPFHFSASISYNCHRSARCRLRNFLKENQAGSIRSPEIDKSTIKSIWGDKTKTVIISYIRRDGNFHSHRYNPSEHAAVKCRDERDGIAVCKHQSDSATKLDSSFVNEHVCNLPHTRKELTWMEVSMVYKAENYKSNITNRKLVLWSFSHSDWLWSNTVLLDWLYQTWKTLLPYYVNRFLMVWSRPNGILYINNVSSKPVYSGLGSNDLSFHVWSVTH